MKKLEQNPNASSESDDDNEDIAELENNEKPLDMKELHLLIAQGKISLNQSIRQKNMKRTSSSFNVKSKVNWRKVAYQFYISAVSCVILALSIRAYVKQEVHIEELEQINYNFEQEPLVELNYTTSDKVCSNAFGDGVNLNCKSQYTEFFAYHWPGTKVACDCTEGQDIQDKLKNIKDGNTSSFFASQFQIDRVCSVQQKEKLGCKTVEKLQDHLLSMWIEGLYGIPFTLCSKRISGVTFAKNYTINNQCQDSTMKLCQKSQVCVPADSKCPITRIGFTNDQYYQQIVNKEVDGEIIVINHTLSVYYIRDDSPAISQVQVTEASSNQTVCANNKLNNISPGRVEYPLMESYRRQCQPDLGFTRIHQINEEQFYLANNILYFKQLLPYYQISTQDYWGIFVKRYVDWDDNCRTTLLAEIKDVANSIGIIYKSLKYLLSITVAYFIIVGLILPIIGITSAANQYITFMKTTRKKQYSIIFFYEIIFKTILETTEMVIIIVSFVYVYNKSLIVDVVIKEKCTTNELALSVFLSVSGDIYDFIWSGNLAILVIFSIVLLFDLYLLIDSYRKKQIEDLNDWAESWKKCYNHCFSRKRSAQIRPLKFTAQDKSNTIMSQVQQ